MDLVHPEGPHLRAEGLKQATQQQVVSSDEGALVI